MTKTIKKTGSNFYTFCRILLILLTLSLCCRNVTSPLLIIAGGHCSFHRCMNGPLARYVKLWVAHAPGMPETFSPPPTSKETASYRSRQTSRHVRNACAVMHVGIANPWRRGNVPGIPGACATRNFTYLTRGPWPLMNSSSSMCWISLFILKMYYPQPSSKSRSRWCEGV